MKITIGGKVLEMAQPQRISDIIENKNRRYICAKVNNQIKDLNYIPEDNSIVELLDLSDVRAVKMYVSTLRYVIAMAIKRLWPAARALFNYSISRSIFCSISHFGHSFGPENLKRLENEVIKIIKDDLPIHDTLVSKEEAMKIYKKQSFYDKLEMIKNVPIEKIPITECDGYYDFLYDYSLPSTGFITKFKLRLYSPGFLIFYPRSESKGEIPDFNEEKVFRDVLREANYWSNIIKINTINQINGMVRNGRALELINICETRHNDQIAEIGRKIFKEVERLRLICVAGPSSSGKTTFTNRIRIELYARGIVPLMISMDDFYFDDPSKYPLDEKGRYDYEHLNALDLELFDDVIFRLIHGEEVALPKFNFKTKKRTFGKPIKIDSRQPILIEGIHGLDDAICPSIPLENKYKIFIAPLGQYRVDDHTPISLSDMRLVRRMVRDRENRNTPPEQTIASWQSVRAGEFKWIYRYQNNADVVFNSELAYEPLVLAKHAIPALKEIKPDSQYYITARRLLLLLEYYESISDKWIPCNSILREFIGGSIFYTEDKR